MAPYTKKPVTIEAFRWTGGPDQGEDPVWICDAIRDGVVQFVEAGFMSIQTTEGTMNASQGDWIIRGVEGEIYPCKDSVFQATYAPAAEGLFHGDAIGALFAGFRAELKKLGDSRELSIALTHLDTARLWAREHAAR